VSLESFDIIGIQYVPKGQAYFTPLSNLTYLSNSTPVTSGLFAWILWGGGPGDPVNLDSVASTNLSTTWLAMISPADPPHTTNLTRASALVCDPHLQIMSRMAYDFDGSVGLDPLPDKYGTKIGNIDKDFVSYMIYNYATQQAVATLDMFRNTIIGQATGKATLTSDPNNPDGSVPRSTADIAPTLDPQANPG